MSNIELPFNVKQISKKELDNLIKRVKKGEEDIYLEVRDNEKNLISSPIGGIQRNKSTLEKTVFIKQKKLPSSYKRPGA